MNGHQIRDYSFPFVKWADNKPLIKVDMRDSTIMSFGEFIALGIRWVRIIVWLCYAVNRLAFFTWEVRLFKDMTEDGLTILYRRRGIYFLGVLSWVLSSAVWASFVVRAKIAFARHGIKEAEASWRLFVFCLTLWSLTTLIEVVPHR